MISEKQTKDREFVLKTENHHVAITGGLNEKLNSYITMKLEIILDTNLN